MIKHYCDICKEDITNNLFINELEFNFLNGCSKESKLEICEVCANQILDFVNNLEELSKKDNSKMKKKLIKIK